jgi:glycosyltransferase involved in cell wall biosynthesis
LKVVHLAPHFDNSGNGVVNVAIDLACLQARKGLEVVFIGAHGSFADLLLSHGVAVYPLALSSPPRLLANVRTLRRILRKFDPDIVHAHMVPGALAGVTVRHGLRFGLVTSIHSSGRAGTELMAVGDVAICVSNYLAQEMRRRGISAAKLKVVRNGTVGSPRARGLPEAVALNRPAIVTVAEISVFKGIGDLISAFSMLNSVSPPPHLYLLGDGTQRYRFEAQARRTACADRVVFCGPVRDPTPYLQSSDIFVLASHREGFGLALAEARTAGCAIVATDVGGIPEVLDEGEAGILVPARSPPDLALALLQLLEDPARLVDWRARARRNLDWLSCERAADETLKVYSDLMAAKRHEPGMA